MLDFAIFSKTSKFINVLRCPKAQIPSKRWKATAFHFMKTQEFLSPKMSKQFICSSASLCCYVRHVSMVLKRIGNRKGMMLNYKGVYSHFFPMISNTPPVAPAVIWGCRLEQADKNKPKDDKADVKHSVFHSKLKFSAHSFYASSAKSCSVHERIAETNDLTDYLIHTLPVEAAQVKYIEFILKCSILNLGTTFTAYCG